MKLETPWYTNATFLDAIYICELELEQVYYYVEKRRQVFRWTMNILDENMK